MTKGGYIVNTFQQEYYRGDYKIRRPVIGQAAHTNKSMHPSQDEEDWTTMSKLDTNKGGRHADRNVEPHFPRDFFKKQPGWEATAWSSGGRCLK